MTTITFSYLDNVTSVDLISLLKRVAKQTKTGDVSTQKLAWHQDRVAVALGFKNWSMLHKRVDGSSGASFSRLLHQVLDHQELGPAISALATRTIDVEDAVHKMKTWAREKYSPLINFAFYDDESATGFSWPDVDMANELSLEFEGQYPSELIVQVGNDLDIEEGPWGLENYGDDE